MFDRRLRHTKERVLYPAARLLGQYASPTQITLIGGIFGLLAAFAVMQAAYGVALLLWLINRVLDGLDGSVARLFNRQTDFGGYIDILVDNVVYAAIPIGFVIAQPRPIIVGTVLTMLAIFYVNNASWMFLSSILEKRNRGVTHSGEMTSITMPDGIIGGTETVIAYALFLLLPLTVEWLFMIYGGLTVVTILQRIVWAQRHLGDE